MDNGRIGEALRAVIDWLDTQTVLDEEFRRTCWERLKAVERIRATDSMETACMRPFSNGKYVIYVNLAFLEKHVFNNDNPVTNFAFVLLHEVLHRERRDGTRMVPGLNRHWSGTFKNFVLDIFVNSTLYRNGFPPDESVTRELYDANSPGFLLLPPHHLFDEINQDERFQLEPPAKAFGEKTYTEFRDRDAIRNRFRSEVYEPLRSILDEAMKRDWCESSESYDRLLNCYLNAWFDRPSLKQVARTLAELLDRLPLVKTIGGHGDGRGGKGRGDGDTEELELDSRRKQKVNKFVGIVKKALVESDTASCRRYQRAPQRGIRPTMDRRSSYLMASRTWPVFFENDIEAKQRTREAAYLYIDSSSSMSDEMIHFVSCLVLGADEYISNPIYLFATEVKPVNLQELRSGKRLSGGTKINPVLDHAREKGLEQLVVLTDGYVEDVKPKNRRYLEQANLFTLFNFDAQAPLKEHSTEHWKNLEDNMQERTGSY